MNNKEHLETSSRDERGMQEMDLKFRFLKFETEKKWHTYFPVSQQKLNNIIKKHNPKNVYISKNKFLFYKEHPSYSHQNKIYQEYGLLDIDGQNFSDKEECKNYFFETLNFLTKNNVEIERITQTNSTIGGYQALIKPCCLKKFFNLLENHPQYFQKADSRVHDFKRVMRYAPSWNGNRNSESIIIYPSEYKYLNTKLIQQYHPLGMPQENAKKGVFRQKIVRINNQHLEPVLAGKPSKADSLLQEADDMGAGKHPPPFKTNVRRDNKSTLPDTFLVKEMSNSVLGVKSLYVPALKFRHKPSKRLIKGLQRQYSLGDIYLFQNHLNFTAISPKCVQSRRLEKVYFKAKSWQSLNEIQKFRQNWICISNILDLGTKEIKETFKFLDVYQQDVNGSYSKPHLMFLNRFFGKEYPNVIGLEKSKIYNAVFTTQ